MLVEEVLFAKIFRIVRLDGKKCQWVVEQDFIGIFGSTLRVFFLHFICSSPACLPK